MPENFSNVNLIHLVLGVVIIAVSVLYALLGVLSFRKKRIKALEIIAFIVNIFVIVLFVAFLLLCIFSRMDGLPFAVDENFAIIYGDSVIEIPVLGEMIIATIKYPLFMAISIASLVTSQFSFVVQMVKRGVSKQERVAKTEAKLLDNQTEVDVTAVKSDVAYEEERAKPTQISGIETRESRVKTLRGKTFVKGDARQVYYDYLAEKNAKNGEINDNAQ